MDPICRHVAPIFLVGAVWSCGARSDIDFVGGLDATHAPTVDAGRGLDATVDRDSGRDVSIDHTVDRRPPPEDTGHDSGHDAPHHRHDGGHKRADAGQDSGHDSGADSGHDAGHDAGRDTGRDTGVDAECPTLYPGTGVIACSVFGAVCTYPQGVCTCYGACGCGIPPSCAEGDFQCGPFYSLCDEELDCGKCPAGQSCGGGGVVGKCAPVLDAGGCVARTCAEVPGQCGVVVDGCGGELDCGRCLEWGCTPAQPACPSDEPKTGVPCESEGTVCNYTEWTGGCCTQAAKCAEGIWSLSEMQCPE